MSNKWMKIIGILGFVAIVFSPVLFNGFIHNDDPTHLLENPAVRALTLDNLNAIFHSFVNVTYNPLTTLSFAFEYYFFGYTPLIYHLDNLLLHLAVVWMAWLWFEKLGITSLGAVIAALIFGIHPLHVESVAWVTERKDVLYGFFYLLSLLRYADYVKNHRSRDFALSLIFGILSILAKPMALSLPLILWAYDWWQGRASQKQAWLEKVPFVLCLWPIAWITYAVNARMPIHSLSEAVMFWVWCFIFYIRKFIVPGELLIFYQYPQPISWANAQYALSLGAFLLLIIGLFLFRKNRLFVFGMAFYFLSIFFLLRFDDVKNINPVSDRFMYLPCLGFCVWAGELFAGWMTNKLKPKLAKLSTIILVSWLMAFAGQAFIQSRIWKDGALLWTQVIKHSPNLALAYVHRGTEYQSRAEAQKAIDDYKKAIALEDDPYAHSNLAMIYKDHKNWDLALKEYDAAITIKPYYWGWYFDRGNLLREMGQWDLAIHDYTRALNFKPGLSEVYANRGVVLMTQQQDSLALNDFNSALKFNPREVSALNNRAVIYAREGKYDLAIRDFSQSIFFDSLNASIYYNRGLAYMNNRQYDLALRDFDQALSLSPDYTQARDIKNKLIEQKFIP